MPEPDISTLMDAQPSNMMQRVTLARIVECLMGGWIEAANVELSGGPPVNCKRDGSLSITHKILSNRKTQFDIDEAGDASPHDHVSGRRIPGAGEVAAKTGDFYQVV
jgi:hypothetical protein